MSLYDLIIVGAGPTGLACAIEAKRAGLRYLVIEKGGITDAIRRFPTNMTFFSTPELLELGDVPFTTANVRPSRAEALQYYRHMVASFALNIELHTAVTGISSGPESGFLVATAAREIACRRVIVATGYFDHTNRLDVPGEDLPHVSHYYDEPYAYAMTRVVVVGGRNSAVEAALELYRHGAHVSLVHRRSELSDSVKYWIRPDIENRLRDGAITAFFDSVVTEIASDAVVIRNVVTEATERITADFVLPLIGYRPDEVLLRQAGVELDSRTLVPAYCEQTFETNVPGLYIAGSVACGCETWNIFIENGRAHARPIIQDIVSRRQ